MPEHVIAGGRLLQAILEANLKVIDVCMHKNSLSDPSTHIDEELVLCYNELSSDKRNSLTECIKECSKKATLAAVISGRWRKHLSSSLELADALMDTVRDGYEYIFDYVIDLKFKLLDKGLTGTGSGIFQAVFGVGLEVDWLLGLPYYPASTVKGAVRAAAEALLGDDEARALFGESSDSGSWASALVFSDAYPVGCVKDGRHPCLVFTGDVVTPHYFKPGEGLVKREMDATPTPILHVAVAPDTVFRVVAGLNLDRVKRVKSILEKARSKGLLSSGEAGDNGFGVALLVARLTASALATGFAARSGKGYNIMLPLSSSEARNLDRSVVSLRVRLRKKPGERPQTRRRGPPGGRRGAYGASMRGRSRGRA